VRSEPYHGTQLAESDSNVDRLGRCAVPSDLGIVGRGVDTHFRGLGPSCLRHLYRDGSCHCGRMLPANEKTEVANRFVIWSLEDQQMKEVRHLLPIQGIVQWMCAQVQSQDGLEQIDTASASF
jgi:hypothetical protein